MMHGQQNVKKLRHVSMQLHNHQGANLFVLTEVTVVKVVH